MKLAYWKAIVLWIGRLNYVMLGANLGLFTWNIGTPNWHQSLLSLSAALYLAVMMSP